MMTKKTLCYDTWKMTDNTTVWNWISWKKKAQKRSYLEGGRSRKAKEMTDGKAVERRPSEFLAQISVTKQNNRWERESKEMKWKPRFLFGISEEGKTKSLELSTWRKTPVRSRRNLHKKLKLSNGWGLTLSRIQIKKESISLTLS